MVSVKLFLYIVYTTLLVADITCSVDDVPGLVDAPVSSAEPPYCTPTVNYCISVYDGKPVLRVLAKITSGWAVSESLKFSLSYKHGASPVVMDASCVDHNCTSLFLIDWEYEKVDNNSTINVTASVEGCSNSTVKMASELWNNQIVDITLGEVMDTTTTIVCKLSCFTKEIGCIPVDTNLTFHTSNITGDPNSYSYRSQNVTVTNLASSNTYNVCVSAYNLTTTELQGIVLCKVFTTHRYHKGNRRDVIIPWAVAMFVAIVAVPLFVAMIILCCCYLKLRCDIAAALSDEPQVDNVGSDQEQLTNVASSDDPSGTPAE